MLRVKEGLVRELHAPARRNYPRTRIKVKGIFTDLWSIDLLDMTKLPDRGYHYILTVVDSGSKRGWAIPLKSKTGLIVRNGLLAVFKEAGFTPRLIHSDDGKEFKNKHVDKLFKEYGIHRYSTYSSVKAALAERFNRTIKERLWKQFSLQGNYKWVSMLPKILWSYNHSVHRSIGMKPADVNKKHERTILFRLGNPTLKKQRHPKYNKGDVVRISKFKSLFEKGYTPNWSTELFVISTVYNTYDVPMYKLVDRNENPIAGLFYEEEIKKTSYPNDYLVEKVLKKQGNRVLVKWLGFKESENSWIPKEYIYK